MSKMDDSASTLLLNVRKTNALLEEIKTDVAKLEGDYPWVKDPEQVKDAEYKVYLEIRRRQSEISSKLERHRMMLKDVETRLTKRMYTVYDFEDASAVKELKQIFDSKKDH